MTMMKVMMIPLGGTPSVWGYTKTTVIIVITVIFFLKFY